MTKRLATKLAEAVSMPAGLPGRLRARLSRLDVKICLLAIAIVVVLAPSYAIVFGNSYATNSFLHNMEKNRLAVTKRIAVASFELTDIHARMIEVLTPQQGATDKWLMESASPGILDRIKTLEIQLNGTTGKFHHVDDTVDIHHEIVARYPIFRQLFIDAVEFSGREERHAEAHIAAINAVYASLSKNIASLISKSVQANRRSLLALTETSDRNFRRSITIAAVCFALTLLLALVTSRTISRPLTQISDVLRTLAATRIDLTIPFAERRDEIGELADAALAFRKKNDELYRLQEEAVARNAKIEKQSADLTEALENEKAATLYQRQFVSTMSHEIRTPLNGIMGMADLMLRQPLQEKQKHYMKTLASASGNLLKIINQILDFSKLEAGKQGLNYSETILGDMVRSVTATFCTIAAEKSVSIVVDCPWDLPHKVRIDPDRLRQILLNLLGNALKFTAKGHVRLEIRVEEDDKANCLGRLSVTVSDTGIGMTDEQISRVFKPFVQADGTTTRKFGGTGLGLTISRQLVEMMGGTISVASTEGEGTAFSFEVPVTYRRDSVELSRAREALGNCRILVVTTCAATRDVVLENLESTGIDAKSAPDAREATMIIDEAEAEGTPVDIVLVDEYLPDTNYRDLAKSLQNTSRLRGPYLVLMANMQVALDSAGTEGIGLLYEKPVILPDLIEKLAYALTSADAVARTMNETESVEAIIANGSADRDLIALAGVRVLLVEDDPNNQLFAGELLAEFECDVTLASNGSEALGRAHQANYDIILMDCMMPILDGLEATQLLRQDMLDGIIPNTPIVALTANASKEDRERCLKAGMDDYLSKPFFGDDLSEMITRWALSPVSQSSPEETESQKSEEQIVMSEPSSGIQGPPDTSDAAGAGDGEGSMDWETFSKTEAAMKTHFDTLLDGFVDLTNEYLGDIAAALKSGDTASISLKAHTIKSSARLLGAVRLAALAQELETQAKTMTNNAAELDRLQSHSSDVAKAFEEAHAHIRKRIAAVA